MVDAAGRDAFAAEPLERIGSVVRQQHVVLEDLDGNRVVEGDMRGAVDDAEGPGTELRLSTAYFPASTAAVLTFGRCDRG